MEAKAIAKFVRVGPRKVDTVLALIRKKSVKESFDILRFTPKAACEIVGKVLKSAMTNLKSRKQADELYVKEAHIAYGPSLKRMRAMAMGRGAVIRRRLCHVTVVVTDEAMGKKKLHKK
jgi:large subunit ribosomal protein L22